MPVDTHEMSWAELFENHAHHKNEELLDIVFDMESTKLKPNFDYLICLKYLKLLFAIDNLNHQGLLILIRRCINYDNQKQIEVEHFKHQFQSVINTYQNHLPSCLQPLPKLIANVYEQCTSGFIGKRYCFLFSHYNWLLRSMSNFVFGKSKDQHAEYLQKSIMTYIEKYYQNHCVNGHLIKSNLPPYVQYKLELYYLTQDLITQFNQCWAKKMTTVSIDDLQIITNLAIKHHIYSQTSADQLIKTITSH